MYGNIKDWKVNQWQIMKSKDSECITICNQYHKCDILTNYPFLLLYCCSYIQSIFLSDLLFGTFETA